MIGDGRWHRRPDAPTLELMRGDGLSRRAGRGADGAAWLAALVVALAVLVFAGAAVFGRNAGRP